MLGEQALAERCLQAEQPLKEGDDPPPPAQLLALAAVRVPTATASSLLRSSVSGSPTCRSTAR